MASLDMLTDQMVAYIVGDLPQEIIADQITRYDDCTWEIDVVSGYMLVSGKPVKTVTVNFSIDG